MQVATACLQGAFTAAGSWQPTAVVTCHSPGWQLPFLADRMHLQLAFHDIELAWDGRLDGPCHHHVAGFLDVVAERPDRLLVHCTAGLGRSPALAIVAAVAAGIDPLDACQQLHGAVPEASPNRRLLHLGGEVLGLGDRIVEASLATFTFQRTRTGAVGPATGFRLPFPACGDAKPRGEAA